MTELPSAAGRHTVGLARSAGPALAPLWVRRALGDAAQRFGLAGLDDATFAREAAPRLAARHGEPIPPEALATTAGGDLALAIACDLRLPGAWEALIDAHATRLAALLRSRGTGHGEADDLVAELWGELALPPPDGRGRTRLAAFCGAASLGAWLGVVLLRRRVDRARDRLARERTRDGDESAAREGDPAAAAQDAEERARLRAAFCAAWRALPVREALALALRYGQDLRLEPIARALGVGVPRTSRILKHAEGALERELRRCSVSLKSGAPAELAAELAVFLANPDAPHDLARKRSEEQR